MADSSTGLYKDLSSHWNLTKYQLNAFFVLLVLILISGVIGNILSVVIWSKGNRCSKIVSSTYFQLLAVSDLTVLLLPVTVEVIDLRKFPQRFKDYNDNKLMHENEFLCKLLNFFLYFCPQVSAWMTVSLTIERTLSIAFPIRFYRTSAYKRAYIVFGVILLASFALNAPIIVQSRKIIESFPYYYRNGTASNETYTLALCHSQPDNIKSKYISLFYFTFAIPFLVLTFCNIAILIKLCKNKHLANSNNSRIRIQRSIKNVTQLVFGVSALQLCISGVPMAYTFTRYSSFIRLQIDLVENNLYFFFVLALEFYFLNSSVNWILYSLVGTDFRKDVRDLLKTCICCFVKMYGSRYPRGTTPVQLESLNTTVQRRKRIIRPTEQVKPKQVDTCKSAALQSPKTDIKCWTKLRK